MSHELHRRDTFCGPRPMGLDNNDTEHHILLQLVDQHDSLVGEIRVSVRTVARVSISDSPPVSLVELEVGSEVGVRRWRGSADGSGRGGAQGARGEDSKGPVTTGAGRSGAS